MPDKINPLSKLVKPKESPLSSLFGGKQDVIRGSSDVPLTAEGKAQALRLGQETKGKIDCIYTSPLERAKDTAEQIHKTNPKAELKVKQELMPWKLGAIEGQPTQQMLPKMHDLILNHPDQVPPGKGPKSTAEGESFNHFRKRVLGFIQDEIKEHDPKDVDIYVTHYRDIKIVEAWLAKGHSKDLSIDTSVMLNKGREEPGEMFKMENFRLVPVTSISGPGIYFARHGRTEWNGES